MARPVSASHGPSHSTRWMAIHKASAATGAASTVPRSTRRSQRRFLFGLAAGVVAEGEPASGAPGLGTPSAARADPVLGTASDDIGGTFLPAVPGGVHLVKNLCHQRAGLVV